MAGQPRKFKSGAELIDGRYIVDENNLRFNDFGKETELKTYIVENIEAFCKNVLGDKLVYFETEKPFGENTSKYHKKFRADIFIVCESKSYTIELKNPTYASDNRIAIGQCLAYKLYVPKSELLLITTMFDKETANIIEEFNLPIRYIVMSKTQFLEREK